MTTPFKPNFENFVICEEGKHPPRTRAIGTQEGIGDRLRAVAFAEIQAREAFLWASQNFEDIPLSLKETWVRLAHAEDRHFNWLLTRMNELGFAIEEREVTNRLWSSFLSCKTAREFAHYMANAEEWGRQAGERFYAALVKTDPVTAEIFKKIADEEIAHIQTAHKYFPNTNSIDERA